MSSILKGTELYWRKQEESEQKWILVRFFGIGKTIQTILVTPCRMRLSNRKSSSAWSHPSAAQNEKTSPQLRQKTTINFLETRSSWHISRKKILEADHLKWFTLAEQNQQLEKQIASISFRSQSCRWKDRPIGMESKVEKMKEVTKTLDCRT